MTTDNAANPDDDAVTDISSLDEADQFETLKKLFIRDRNSTADWRREARQDYAFEAGDQWEEEDKARLMTQKRPLVSFNRILPTVNAICGMEVTGRQEVSYLPRSEEDGGEVELYGEAARYVRDQCDAEDEESDAFRDMVVCGVGCTDTRPDYEKNPDGDIIVERMDPTEMVWDGNSKKRNMDDSRRRSHVKRMDKAEAQERWPDVDVSQLHASWANGVLDEDTDVQDRDLNKLYLGGTEDTADNRDTVIIVRTQWFEYETKHRVVDPATGEATFLDPDEWSKVSKAAKATGIRLKSVKQKQRVYRQAFMGGVMLESGECPCKEGFTLNFMTGYRDHARNQWYGIVRPMRDPQRWANTLMSTVLYQISTTGRGLMAERGSFENDEQAQADLSRADRILWAKTGALSGGAPKIVPKPQGQIPAGTDRMMEFSLVSLRDTSGVNTETLGSANRDQAASLEYQRRQTSMTSLASFFDGLRRYRKEEGRILLWEIREYISDGRLIRISGDDGVRYLPLTKRADTVRYDIIVDQAASSPNQKEATWQIVQGLLPVIAPMGLSPDIWKEIIKASPLPESSVDAIVEAMNQQQQAASQQPDPAQMQMQIDAQKMQSDMAMNQQDAQVKQQEMLVKQEELNVKKMELGLRAQELAVNAQQTQQTQTHERTMRGMELQGMENETAIKNPGLAEQFGGIATGLQALAQAMAQSTQVSAQGMAQAVSALERSAAAIAAPKQVIWQDGPNGVPRPVATAPVMVQ